jgi:hypothetical protein
MKIFFLAIFMHLSVMGHAQKLRNEFFVFHHIIAGDKTYNSYESQVKLVKASGFDGIEIGSEESFDEMFEAIEKNHFKCSSFYVKLQVEDKPELLSSTAEEVTQLRIGK